MPCAFAHITIKKKLRVVPRCSRAARGSFAPRLRRLLVRAASVLLCAALPTLSFAQERETVAQSKAYTVTPIYTLLAYKPDKSQHLIHLNDEFILAQIASFIDIEEAKLFLSYHSRIELHGARLLLDDTVNYIVFLGVYEDDDTARWAHESFAEENPNYQTKNFKRVRLGDLKQFIQVDFESANSPSHATPDAAVDEATDGNTAAATQES